MAAQPQTGPVALPGNSSATRRAGCPSNSWILLFTIINLFCAPLGPRPSRQPDRFGAIPSIRLALDASTVHPLLHRPCMRSLGCVSCVRSMSSGDARCRQSRTGMRRSRRASVDLSRIANPRRWFADMVRPATFQPPTPLGDSTPLAPRCGSAAALASTCPLRCYHRPGASDHPYYYFIILFHAVWADRREIVSARGDGGLLDRDPGLSRLLCAGTQSPEPALFRPRRRTISSIAHAGKSWPRKQVFCIWQAWQPSNMPIGKLTPARCKSSVRSARPAYVCTRWGQAVQRAYPPAHPLVFMQDGQTTPLLFDLSQMAVIHRLGLPSLGVCAAWQGGRCAAGCLVSLLGWALRGSAFPPAREAFCPTFSALSL